MSTKTKPLNTLPAMFSSWIELYEDLKVHEHKEGLSTQISIEFSYQENDVDQGKWRWSLTELKNNVIEELMESRKQPK